LSKTIRSYGILFPELLILFSDSSHISGGISYLLTRATLSGQDEVQTSQSVTVSCAPTTQPSRRLIFNQLFNTQHLTLITLSTSAYFSSRASIELGHCIINRIHSLVLLIPPSGATHNSQMAPSTSDSNGRLDDRLFFFIRG